MKQFFCESGGASKNTRFFCNNLRSWKMYWLSFLERYKILFAAWTMLLIFL